MVGHLRLLGVRIFYYLNVWLIVADSRALLESPLLLTLTVTQGLGFLINWEKLSLSPQRLPVYLSAVLDIPRLLARPRDRRIEALQTIFQVLVASGSSTALLWRKFFSVISPVGLTWFPFGFFWGLFSFVF